MFYRREDDVADLMALWKKPTAVISGGIALTGWWDDGNGVWSAPVPARAGDAAAD